MKITRQDQTETNNITAGWLSDFATDLEKNAQNIDYLKDYLNKIHKHKQFNSIEEKLADIRERVGFDLARKITNEIEKTSNASEEDCGCNSSSKSCSCPVKTASEHQERDVQIMGNILNYIKDMVEHEPHLDSTTIISRCKNEEGLRFNDIESRIDRAKLISYIKDLLGKQEDDGLASYVPQHSESRNESEDQIAEYYNHAEPSLS